jgi:hypothetical protein
MEKTLRVLNRLDEEVEDSLHGEAEMKTYPTVTPVLKQKAARRKRQAGLTFEQKIAIVDKWRKLTRKIQKSRSSSQRTQVR